MEFSVSHYTAQDLDSAYHTYDLHPRAEVILNLDYRQRGLGTESCGPGPLEHYKINQAGMRGATHCSWPEPDPITVEVRLRGVKIRCRLT